MSQIDDRVTALEIQMENLSKWVIYWDGEKYQYCNLGYAKREHINYDSTKYDCAADARAAAMALNNQ